MASFASKAGRQARRTAGGQATEELVEPLAGGPVRREGVSAGARNRTLNQGQPGQAVARKQGAGGNGGITGDK